MSKPSREEAMQAVKTLIEWAGDDPTREGLVETPKRVVAAYEEFFEGYTQDPEEILRKTFEEVEGYDEMVIVKDIRLESHCELTMGFQSNIFNNYHLIIPFNFFKSFS